MTAQRNVGVVQVLLGETRDGSVAPTVFALVERAVAQRPSLAESLAGRVVRLRIGQERPVLLRFAGGLVDVGDDDGTVAADLEIAGRLGDVTTLIAAPLAGGVPKPTAPAGRAALARLADGRVTVRGPKTLGRRVLQLLSLS